MTTKETAETFITRAEMARALGKSKTTVRRWEESGKLKPVKNEHGVNLFRPEDALTLNGGARVRTLPKARAVVPGAANASSELAAEIFERLDRGIHAVEIVKELRAHPDVVEGFAGRWARLRRALLLTHADVRTLEKALSVDYLQRPSDLVSLLEARLKAERRSCTACKESRAVLCKDCIDGHIRRVVRARFQEFRNAAGEQRVRREDARSDGRACDEHDDVRSRATPEPSHRDRPTPAVGGVEHHDAGGAGTTPITVGALIQRIAQNIAGASAALLVREESEGRHSELIRLVVGDARAVAEAIFDHAASNRRDHPGAAGYYAVHGDTGVGIWFLPDPPKKERTAGTAPR
jgi:hypothetical protein